MECYKRQNGEDVISDRREGEVIINQLNDAHLIEALEDSWVLDLKPEVQIGEFSTSNYEPYRSIVTRKNSK